MRQKTLVTICGAAIAVSMWLPWVKIPLAGAASPWDFFKGTDWTKLAEQPPWNLVFLGSFALGALAAILAVVGWAPRLLAFVTALVPFALAAYAWSELKGLFVSQGLPLPSGATLMDTLKLVPDLAGIGLYFWGGGAALLLLVALLDNGERY